MPASPQPKHKVSTSVQSPQIKAPPTLSAEGVVFEESVSERLKPETPENRPREKPISTAIKSVPIPKQSTVAKLPAVHPARLRKLSFLPSPRAQGPEDVVQAFISEIGECTGCAQYKKGAGLGRCCYVLLSWVTHSGGLGGT